MPSDASRGHERSIQHAVINGEWADFYRVGTINMAGGAAIKRASNPRDLHDRQLSNNRSSDAYRTHSGDDQLGRRDSEGHLDTVIWQKERRMCSEVCPRRPDSPAAESNFEDGRIGSTLP